MALQLLDGSELRGKTLHVEQAQFQMKGSYNPGLKPKKRKRKDKEKLKKQQEKLFDWHPDKLRGERGRNERCVVVKNLFEPSLFDKEVSLILEYQQDLREECGKCGEVRKVIIYDRNPEGVAQIFFREAEEADECIKLLNDRWFGQRKITAEQWDGKTKYKIGETDAEIKARLQNWESFLEAGDTDDSKPKSEAEDKKESEKTTDPAKSTTPEENTTEKNSDSVEAEKSCVTEDNSKVSNVQEQSNVESDADSGDETDEDA